MQQPNDTGSISTRLRKTRLVGCVLFSTSIAFAGFLGFLSFNGILGIPGLFTEKGSEDLNSRAALETVVAIKILKPLTGRTVEFTSKSRDAVEDSFGPQVSDDENAANAETAQAGAVTCDFVIDETLSKKMRENPGEVFQQPETIEITSVEDTSESLNVPGKNEVFGFSVDRIYSLNHPHVKKLKCGRTLIGKSFLSTETKVLKFPAADEINKVLSGLAEVSTN